jgi:cation diffusion facilitator CzcD-associated flavoprotein CzcO
MGMGDETRIAIIGTGFAGLGMAIRLKQQGIHDFVVLEKADDVGGTWRENTYPGVQCDVPSHLYSFSFAPNPNWTRTFPLGDEIRSYLRDCAERFGVLPHIRFNEEVTAAEWDDEAQRWELETVGGTLRAQILVAGTGPLHAPSIPDVPGLENFEGRAFHSAEWDHSHDLTGKRVAVVGTGASAIQLVPRVQRQASHLSVFQRTPPWVVPHNDRPITALEKKVYSTVPQAQLAMRAGIYWARESFVLGFVDKRFSKLPEAVARRHIAKQIEDPELRRKVTPTYTLGCKRVLISNEYYPALTQPNVDLVTDGIAEVRANSIVTTGGEEHEVDTIIFGTGFHVTDPPSADVVRGRDGRTLAEHWNGSMEAHRGTTIAGFPNLFFLVGPNTGLGHTSIVFMIESQVNYVLDALKVMDERGLASVDVKADAQQRFNDRIHKQLSRSVWNSGGCASWYLDANGRNTTLWPGFTWPFRRMLRHFDDEHYELRTPTRAPEPAVAEPAAA